MEDAHILKPSLTQHNAANVALYAVFDGHGGPEVAQFAERHMPQVLLENDEFKRGNYGAALSQAFLTIDQMLEKPKHQLEIGMTPAGGAGGEGSGSIRDDGAGTSVGTRESLKQAEAKKMLQQMMVMRRALQGGRVAAGGGDDGDKKVCQLAEHPVKCGCTAVAALIVGNKIIVANAGDSRGVLSRNGTAFPLSFDHKPNDADETARIVGAGGFVTSQNGHFRVNGNLNLSRSLGDMKYKQNTALPAEQQMITASPDILTETLREGDEFIILACDGVWDVMSNQEAVDFVRSRLQKGVPLGKISEQVFDHCIADDPKLTKGIGGDNMTCMIVNLK